MTECEAIKPNIGIDEKNFKEISEILVRLASDQFILTELTYEFSKNVVGPRTYQLHELFKTQACKLCEKLNETDEEIRRIAYRVPTVHERLKMTRIGNLPEPKWHDADTMLRKLLDGHEKIVQFLVKDTERLTQFKECAVGDFVLEMIRFHRCFARCVRPLLENDSRPTTR